MHRYVGWKVPLLLESEEADLTRVKVSDGDIDDVEGQYYSNETDQYDGSDPANWNKLMTNITNSTTISYDEYENTSIDVNPSRFYAMFNELTPMEAPQTANEKVSAEKIADLLDKVRPYIGRKIYIGKEGRCHYFMRPEAVGNGIKMNCTLSITM
jgi:hypothetical protein